MIHRRILFALAVIITIAAGLASRKYPELLPAWMGKYPGDVLWAQMIYWGVGLIAPSMSAGRVAVVALAICYADELSQLYQAPWINEWRATTVGHLVLGSEFRWGDLLAYTLGVGIVGVLRAVVVKNRSEKRNGNLCAK